MGSTFAKLALHLIRGAMGPAVGPTQFSVETKGGCDLFQWALHMALESNGRLFAACLDGVNAFGETNRDCIRAAIMANPSLHLLLPLFEMLYERGSGELFYYDENGYYIAIYYSKNGVRQGCVLGAFLFCLAMQHVYSRLGALLGPKEPYAPTQMTYTSLLTQSTWR